MTPRKPSGYANRKVILDMQDLLFDNEYLLADAIDDLLDGDNDTTVAQRNLNQIGKNNFSIFAVQEALVSGEFMKAEELAEKIARQRRNTSSGRNEPKGK